MGSNYVNLVDFIRTMHAPSRKWKTMQTAEITAVLSVHPQLRAVLCFCEWKGKGRLVSSEFFVLTMFTVFF